MKIYTYAMLLTAALSLSGCATRPSPGPATDIAEIGVMKKLAEVEGRFYLLDDGQDVVFSNPPLLAQTIAVPAAQNSHMIVELVDCLDNDTPARATLEDNAMPVGLVCYAVLSMLVQHEEFDEQSDLIAWDGHFYVEEGSHERRVKAKAAWKKVLENKNYRWRASNQSFDDECRRVCRNQP